MTGWWYERKSQRITKVTRIRPLGTHGCLYKNVMAVHSQNMQAWIVFWKWERTFRDYIAEKNILKKISKERVTDLFQLKRIGKISLIEQWDENKRIDVDGGQQDKTVIQDASVSHLLQQIISFEN